MNIDAILLVDLQHAFPVPDGLLARIERESLRYPRRIFTQFVNPPHSLFRRRLHRDQCAPGSAEGRLRLTLRASDLVLEKQGYGLSGDAIGKITALGIRKILICGVDTDACVLAVAFCLFDSGVECEIDPELCWSSAGLHDAALEIIREQFATA